MAEFELLTFTPEKLVQVETEWRDVAGVEAFEIELASVFDWCAENRSPRPGHGLARGLIDDSGQCAAILETVPSPARSRTKLLKIWVSPAMWSGDVYDEGIMRQLIATHVGAYTTLIFEAAADGLALIKIYGRDDLALNILKEVRSVWDETATGWDARIEGRWLALSRESSTTS